MTPLGRVWLWATRKLARGPDSALVPQALLNLLARAGALRGLFGAISHGLWLAGLGAALATLLALLTTASYRFIWATTPVSYTHLARVVNIKADIHALGVVLGQLVREIDVVEQTDFAAQHSALLLRPEQMIRFRRL